MQQDFFNVVEGFPPILLIDHASPEYGPRTAENARNSDVTVAFAVDFTTAGERLTHKVAGNRYIGIPFGTDITLAAEKLSSFMMKREARTINIAGNGLYTLAKFDVSQDLANRWVFEVMRLVLKDVRIEHIRSGGQTGIDMAGLTAGIVLDIRVTGLFPKGFRQRTEMKKDVLRTAESIQRELAAAVLTLQLKNKD